MTSVEILLGKTKLAKMIRRVVCETYGIRCKFNTTNDQSIQDISTTQDTRVFDTDTSYLNGCKMAKYHSMLIINNVKNDNP